MANPLGFDQVMAADEREEMFAATSATLAGQQCQAEPDDVSSD